MSIFGFDFKVATIAEGKQFIGSLTGNHKNCLPLKKWRKMNHISLYPLIPAKL